MTLGLHTKENLTYGMHFIWQKNAHQSLFLDNPRPD